MATSPTEQTTPPTAASNSQSLPEASNSSPRETQMSSTPVEMSTLQSQSLEPPSTDAPTSGHVPSSKDENTAPQSQSITVQSKSEIQTASDPAIPPSPARATAPATLTRAETEAIGPSTDVPATKPDTSDGPVVMITLLLTKTSARHPFKIDEKYLKKRNINVDGNDPWNISVYTMKELIWRDWREEWEPRPSSPSSIRLIYFGRMLDDKTPLKDCRLQTEAPNVVHMTVRPQELVDDEDAKTGKGGSRRDGDDETHAGCRCVIL